MRFDRIGPAYVFCKLHPDMMAVVLAVDSSLFGVSDRSKHISIPNVLPGRYLLHVWYDGATKQELKALERSIILGRRQSSAAIDLHRNDHAGFEKPQELVEVHYSEKAHD